MCKLNIFDKLSFLLVLIGSLNWGTIGLLDFNIVNFSVWEFLYLKELYML
ncbi:DUF378 domain-containing protein [Clostridium butyricum]